MELEDVIRARRSIRRFKVKDISLEILKEILELANLSPSAGNLQARSVIVIKDKESKQKISEISYRQDFIKDAPVVLVICANLEESEKIYGKRGRELYSIQDATIFAAYIQLIAVNYGLGSCWIGAFDDDKLMKLLNIGADKKPVAILPIGYPDEKPHKTSRKKINEIILWIK